MYQDLSVFYHYLQPCYISLLKMSHLTLNFEAMRHFFFFFITQNTTLNLLQWSLFLTFSFQWRTSEISQRAYIMPSVRRWISCFPFQVFKLAVLVSSYLFTSVLIPEFRRDFKNLVWILEKSRVYQVAVATVKLKLLFFFLQLELLHFPQFYG